jgi:hypothetical protein
VAEGKYYEANLALKAVDDAGAAANTRLELGIASAERRLRLPADASDRETPTARIVSSPRIRPFAPFPPPERMTSLFPLFEPLKLRSLPPILPFDA